MATRPAAGSSVVNARGVPPAPVFVPPQIEAWTEAPDQYIADEDDEMVNFSVRDAGERLLAVRSRPTPVHDRGVVAPERSKR